MVKIDKLQKQQILANKRVNTLQTATSNAGVLFKNGMANYLEVITAQQTSLDAQLDLAFIQRQELNARVELYRALGGGWQ